MNQQEQLVNVVAFALMAAVLYFVLIRPAQQRQRQQADMLSKLKVGDHVITAGGIHGVVTGMADEDIVEVRIAEGTIVSVARGAITARLEEEGS